MKMNMLVCCLIGALAVNADEKSSASHQNHVAVDLPVMSEATLEGLISIELQNLPYHEVVTTLGEKADVEIVFPENLRPENTRQSVSWSDVYWKEGLEVLLEPKGLYLMELRPDLYLVSELDSNENVGEEDVDFMELLSGGFMKQYVQNMKEILRDKSWPEAQAEYDWNYYQALQKKGFTGEQAFQLVLMAGQNDMPTLE